MAYIPISEERDFTPLFDKLKNRRMNRGNYEVL